MGGGKAGHKVLRGQKGVRFVGQGDDGHGAAGAVPNGLSRQRLGVHGIAGAGVIGGEEIGLPPAHGHGPHGIAEGDMAQGMLFKFHADHL